MPVTMKDKKQNPKTAKYFLAYKNPNPNRVQPKKRPEKHTKPLKRDPVPFLMEHSDPNECNDDTL